MATTGEKRKMVSAVEFVKAYMAAETIEEVTAKLSIPPGHIRHRANSLRKRGVNLPQRFVGQGQGTNKLDIEGLNALITVSEETTTKTPTQKKGKAK